jgi:hypothetical protein
MCRNCRNPGTRSDAQCQRILLLHLLYPATTCSTPMRGTRLWDRVYCRPTADKAPGIRPKGSWFSKGFAGKIESRRADSNRLPLLQLRVCGRAFLGVAGICKSPIGKGFIVLTIAGYCVRARVKLGSAGREYCASTILLRAPRSPSQNTFHRSS